MKTKYIMFIILIAVYILIQSDEKKTGAGGITLGEIASIGYAGASGEAVSRRKESAEGKFKSTTNILFNGWVILAVIGIAVYMMGGLDFILQNPTLLLFGLLTFGVMALMR